MDLHIFSFVKVFNILLETISRTTRERSYTKSNLYSKPTQGTAESLYSLATPWSDQSLLKELVRFPSRREGYVGPVPPNESFLQQSDQARKNLRAYRKPRCR